jgi:hypothetical protein
MWGRVLLGIVAAMAGWLLGLWVYRLMFGGSGDDLPIGALAFGIVGLGLARWFVGRITSPGAGQRPRR